MIKLRFLWWRMFWKWVWVWSLRYPLVWILLLYWLFFQMCWKVKNWWNCIFFQFSFLQSCWQREGRKVTEITFQKVITANEGTFCRGKLVSLHCKKPLFQKTCIVNGKPVVKNNHLCLCPWVIDWFLIRKSFTYKLVCSHSNPKIRVYLSKLVQL